MTAFTSTEESPARRTSRTSSPMAPHGAIGSAGINATEEDEWRNFLSANGIKSYAIGMGSGITSVTALHPIAYDGQGMQK